jgi:pilus assembly protein CpaB
MKIARIMVLGIALAAGGVAAYLARNSGSSAPPAEAQAQPEKVDTVDILIAKSDIGIGQTLKAEDLDWQAWPSKLVSKQYLTRSDNPNAPAPVLGDVTRAPFVTGEPIRESKLIKAGSGYLAAILTPGMRAVSTDISPESGAGGFILPNDRVDVILTSAEKESDGRDYYKSQTILTDVRVLAIDQAIEEKSGQHTAIGKIATLELSPSDAEKLALARRLGSISVVLRSLAEVGKAGEREASLTRSDSVTVVRFGQSTTQ